MNRIDNAGKLAALYISIWFLVNLLFLMDFPFVHTDELWLSGLSRFMAEKGNLFVTEPFFDALPRHPHAIRILYHGLQLLFFKLAGYGLFQARLLSLLAGAGVLFTAYASSCIWSRRYKTLWPYLFPLWLSLDIQFIYASHFARQEVFLLLFMLLSLFFFYRNSGQYNAFLSGFMIALAIGFHPNSFIISLPAGFLWLSAAVTGRADRRDLIAYTAVVFAGAIFFTGLSLLANPYFITDYAASGRAYGILETPDIKMMRWPLFYQKLLLRISGTYYLPDIRLSPVMLAAAAVPLVRILIRKETIPDRALFCLSLTGLTAYNIGLLVLGKYSQPSIVFAVPFFLIFILASLLTQKESKRRVSAVVFTLLVAGGSIGNIVPEAGREKGVYNRFISDMKSQLPYDAVVLSTLYLEPVLSAGNLHDWRNLAELKGQNMSLKQYLLNEKITHIVIPDEIDFYYEKRPVWNSSYGNPARYYSDLQLVLSESDLISELHYSGYAIRLSRYRHSGYKTFRIYEL